jgi:beta-lactamase regulating signal transducer with metallopeptidase domain
MDKLLHNSHLDWLFRASWQATVVIVLVLALQLAFGQRLSPRWRYAMWLLVVLRLALPWTISSPVSVFNVLEFARQSVSPGQSAGVAVVQDSVVGSPGTRAMAASWPTQQHVHLSLLIWIWAAGAVALAGYLAYSHYQVARRLTNRRPLIDATVMNLLEDCKQLMGVRVPVTLVETRNGGSPALFGFLRPRLLLPSGLTNSFSQEELRHVFLHELSHVKRKDIMVGWIMTALQILHWFNPFVWVAFHRMRVERELACDAMALSYAKESRPYGETIIKLLEGFGCSAWGPSLAGTLENRNQMEERIRMIAGFSKTNRWPAAAMLLLAALGFVVLTDAQTQPTPATSESAPTPPRVVSTSPAVGAVEVEPATSEITVTFDQDMAKGFSWTGGGADYPPLAESRKPFWRDPRTCVLPVKLQAGGYYRVGINSTSYKNFCGTNGMAVAPSAIYFTTQGASPEMKARLTTPQVVACSPSHGDQNVDAALAEVRVTFNVPMGGGCSWCIVGAERAAFPRGREGEKVYWTEDKRTCVLPVTLEAGKTYRLGINDDWNKNFQSEAGVPCEPVEYSFKTR